MVTHLLGPGADESAGDRRANEIMAAGGLWAALMASPVAVRVEPILVHDCATHELLVEFEFLKSPYRVTVTIAPELVGSPWRESS